MRETYHVSYVSTQPTTTLADLRKLVDMICELNAADTTIQFKLRITPDLAREWLSVKLLPL